MSPTGLTSTLRGLNLASARSNTGGKHVVSFTFPVIDLLPQGTTIVLNPPADIERREHPDMTSEHALALRPAFFAKLDVWGADPFSFAAPLEGASKALRDAVEGLRRVAGSSSLYMVSYKTHTNAIGHRFRLIKNSDLASPAQDFDLENKDWNRLVLIASKYPWLSILHNLVSRASDYAFVAVYNTLTLTAGSATANAELAHNKAHWGTYLPRSFADLFLARFTPVTNLDAEWLAGKGDEAVDLRLPCGHQVQIQASQIFALPEADARTQRCPECRARILQAADEEEEHRYMAFDTIKTWKASNAAWAVYDGETIDDAAQLYCNCADLTNALEKALLSLDMPAPTVCPAALSPANFHETAAVMQQFEKIYATPDPDPKVSIGANDLLQMMTSFANDAMKDDPALVSDLPEYSNFLGLWLNRAIGSMNVDLAIRSIEVEMET